MERRRRVGRTGGRGGKRGTIDGSGKEGVTGWREGCSGKEGGKIDTGVGSL